MAIEHRPSETLGLTSLTPQERQEIESHFHAIGEIMSRHNMLQMSAGWRIESKKLDGIVVVRKFSVKGYEKQPPRKAYSNPQGGPEYDAP